MIRFLYILILLIDISTFAQTENCIPTPQNTSNVYFPMQCADTLFYATTGGRMVNWFETAEQSFGKESYRIQQVKYGNGKREKRFYREENGAVYIYDKLSEQEQMLVPANPKKGMKWTSADGTWKYKILHLRIPYATASCSYSDLLEIEAKHTTELQETITSYYKKGVGLIGENRTGFGNTKKSLPFRYIVPKDREIIEQFCSSPHCEGIEDVKTANICVGKSLGSYLKNLFVLKKNTVRGKYIIHILVDLDGSISGVTVSKFPAGGEKTAKQLERIIHSYDRLKPALIDGMIPTMCSLSLPVNI